MVMLKLVVNKQRIKLNTSLQCDVAASVLRFMQGRMVVTLRLCVLVVLFMWLVSERVNESKIKTNVHCTPAL